MIHQVDRHERTCLELLKFIRTIDGVRKAAEAGPGRLNLADGVELLQACKWAERVGVAAADLHRALQSLRRVAGVDTFAGL